MRGKRESGRRAEAVESPNQVSYAELAQDISKTAPKAYVNNLVCATRGAKRPSYPKFRDISQSNLFHSYNRM